MNPCLDSGPGLIQGGFGADTVYLVKENIGIYGRERVAR